MIVGTPARVIERIKEYVAVGVTHFIAMFGRVDRLEVDRAVRPRSHSSVPMSARNEAERSKSKAESQEGIRIWLSAFRFPL